MSNDNVKEQLIQATIKLLRESENPDKITARQIVAQAKVNLAMINYYFRSKNELLNIAVGRIWEDRANEMKVLYDMPILPKEKLIRFLDKMMEIAEEYADIVKPAISYAVLEGDFEPYNYLLPIIRECYRYKKTDEECRLATFQMITTFQLIFLRSKQVSEFIGMDLTVKEQKDKLIQMVVGLYFDDSNEARPV